MFFFQRCDNAVGDDHEPRAFSTHAPCAIALIGKLPSTLDDRSVHVEMKRKTTDEKVASFRFGRTPDLDELARKAARWAADNSEALRGCEPKVPKGIENRQADNWEPLLAIADVAGGKWPETIRKVAVDACGTKEDDSQNIRLLADIRDVIETNGEDNHISSWGLVSALVAMPDREWSECNRGKQLTQNWMARKLKPFRIQSKTVRIGGMTAKGYEIADFNDAFERYLPLPHSIRHTVTNE